MLKIQQFLQKFKCTKELKAFYYKKSNYGEESMDTINIDKSTDEFYKITSPVEGYVNKKFVKEL